MKTKLLYAVAAVILVALLAVAGCSNPLSGGSGTNVRQATVAVTDSGSLAALASGRVEIVLLAGQDQVAGTVNVTNDSENLYVEFLPSEQWCIIETHVHVANSLDGFPLVGRWQTPAPGQFDFKTEHNCEPPYEYTIALGDLDVHEDFIIAAHAKLSDGEVTETAWAAGTRFSDQGNWATYFTYSWTFMLNLDVAPEGTGSVAGQGRYPAGAQVPLSAPPEDDWQFVNWTDEDGDQISDQWEFVYAMPARDHTLTANFEESDEGTGTGLLIVGGNTYLLSELVFTVYGEVDGSGVFEFDVIICSEGTLEAVQGEDPNGVYNVVYLIMFTPESELAEGTYLPGGESQDPLTFSTPADDDASEIWIGFRPAEWEFDERYRIIAGTIEISVNDSIYTIDGNVTVADDVTDDILASFTFVGPVAAILPPGDDDNDDNGNGD